MKKQNVMVHRMASRSFAEGERTDAWEVAQQTGLTELEAAGSLHDLCQQGYLKMAGGSVVDVPRPLYHTFVDCPE